MSHFLIPGEQLTRRRVAGFAIGFAGVVLLIAGEQLASGRLDLTGEAMRRRSLPVFWQAAAMHAGRSSRGCARRSAR